MCGTFSSGATPKWNLTAGKGVGWAMKLFYKIATAQAKSVKDFLRINPSRTGVVLVLRVSHSYPLHWTVWPYTYETLFFTNPWYITQSTSLISGFLTRLSHPVERDRQTKDIKTKKNATATVNWLCCDCQWRMRHSRVGSTTPTKRTILTQAFLLPAHVSKREMLSGHQHSPLSFQWRQLISLHWTWWYKNKQIDNPVISLIGNGKGAGLLGLYQVTQLPAKEALCIFFLIIQSLF